MCAILIIISAVVFLAVIRLLYCVIFREKLSFRFSLKKGTQLKEKKYGGGEDEKFTIWQEIFYRVLFFFEFWGWVWKTKNLPEQGMSGRAFVILMVIIWALIFLGAFLFLKVLKIMTEILISRL
jgi:hypothetical protein